MGDGSVLIVWPHVQGKQKSDPDFSLMQAAGLEPFMLVSSATSIDTGSSPAYKPPEDFSPTKHLTGVTNV